TIAFHEAAHRSLCPSRFWNDAIGYFVGFHALMSLTLYRTVHRYHHAYLATDRDEELWPFNQPDQPRWFRRLAAACELTLGLFYTPLLFLRAFLRRGSLVRNRALRRRIRLELIALAVFWAGLLTLVTLAGVWFY